MTTDQIEKGHDGVEDTMSDGRNHNGHKKILIKSAALEKDDTKDNAAYALEQDIDWATVHQTKDD